MAGLFLLVGCSGETQTNVSSSCADALKKQASAVLDNSLSSTQADNAERPALSACKTVDEWVAGVQANPKSIGYVSADQPTAESAVQLSCYMLDSSTVTPVCADARSRGLLE